MLTVGMEERALAVLPELDRPGDLHWALFAIEETFIPSPFFATFSPYPLLSSLPTPHPSSHNSAWWGLNPAPHFRVITQERDRNKEERLGIFLGTQNELHGQIQ